MCAFLRLCTARPCTLPLYPGTRRTSRGHIGSRTPHHTPYTNARTHSPRSTARCRPAQPRTHTSRRLDGPHKPTPTCSTSRRRSLDHARTPARDSPPQGTLACTHSTHAHAHTHTRSPCPELTLLVGSAHARRMHTTTVSTKGTQSNLQKTCGVSHPGRRKLRCGTPQVDASRMRRARLWTWLYKALPVWSARSSKGNLARGDGSSRSDGITGAAPPPVASAKSSAAASGRQR